MALLVLIPLALVWLFVAEGLVLDLVIVLAVAGLAGFLGHAALDRHAPANPMPERVVPPPQHPFLVMNPRSGGGKVATFGLKEKAEALGAEVALLEGPGTVDVAALARGRPWPAAPTCSAWPAATAPRRWWPASPPSTTSRSW